MHNRMFGLECLRASAVLMVVYKHGAFIQGDSLILKKLYTVFPMGYFFLDTIIFFVLSGYLVGRILIRIISHQHFNSKMLIEFWIRRWARTLPNYFLILSVLIFVTWEQNQPISLLRYVCFSQSFLPAPMGLFPEAWSLCVEEWFYFLVPLLLYISIKLNYLNPQKVILFWGIVITLFCTSIRVYEISQWSIWTQSEWDEHIRKPVIFRLDSIMYGVLAAYVNVYYSKAWERWKNLVFIMACCLLGVLYWLKFTASRGFYDYGYLTLGPLSAALLLPKFSSWKKESGYLVKCIIFISSISYAMYILHLSFIQFNCLPKIMGWILPFPILRSYYFVLQYSLYWLLTISGAYFLSKYYERPLTSLRDKINFNNWSFSELLKFRKKINAVNE